MTGLSSSHMNMPTNSMSSKESVRSAAAAAAKQTLNKNYDESIAEHDNDINEINVSFVFVP